MNDTRRAEQGFTLVEIMMTSALMLVVLAMVLPQLTRSITTFDDARVRSDTTDQAQLAMTQIEHDVLSANVLYLDAALPNGVHMQTFGANGTSTCVEYQVSNGTLQRRTKATSASWPAAAVGWSDKVTNIVNSSQTPVLPVFAIPSSSQYRSLVVTMWVNADTRHSGVAAPTSYSTTVTGRAIPAADTSVAPSGTPC